MSDSQWVEPNEVICCQADQIAALKAENAKLQRERDFAIAAHDGQVQDKDYIAKQSAKLRAALEEGTLLKIYDARVNRWQVKARRALEEVGRGDKVGHG